MTTEKESTNGIIKKVIQRLHGHNKHMTYPNYSDAFNMKQL